MTKNYEAEWAEQASAPANPATGNWKVFFKSDGLYVLEDDGTTYGPFSGTHASTHIDGGSDAIDGDKLEITWTPSTYTRDGTNPTETDSDDDLTAHLKGIDDELASISAGAGYTEGARVYDAGDQTISNTTITAINFDTERYDTDTIHDNATNNTRLTATTAGKYVIVGNVKWAADATGYRLLYFRLNGTTTIGIDTKAAISGQAINQVVATIYSLSATDYVELMVYQTSGGNLDIQANANGTNEFMMQRVG